MKIKVVATFLLLTAGAAICAAGIAGQMPPAPKPGPAHEALKAEAGTWNAAIEMVPAPGAPAMKSSGVETNVIGCGGLCLITDFKGTMAPGETFEGHGVVAYDPAKKKYVGSWTDSMSAGLAISEAAWDPAAKTFSGWMEGPDATGKVMKSRSVSEHKADGSRVLTMFAPGPDGKEFQMMRIVYTKK